MADTDRSPLPPVRRQIVVPTDPDHAFRLWTDELSLWWPFDGHSVFGSDATVGFVDGRLVERSDGGATSVWGTVLEWEPGRLLRLTWHPGTEPALATEVSVRFEPVEVADAAGPHTLVSLEHRGWERRPDAAAARADYDHGWPTVLSCFGAEAGADDRVWLLLAHSAGPAAPTDAPLMASPDFGEHLAFLGRLADEGVLVAAGPLLGADGALGDTSGMTIIRVPLADEAEYRRRAEEDDRSVVRGLLQVTVARWAVGLSGGTRRSA